MAAVLVEVGVDTVSIGDRAGTTGTGLAADLDGVSSVGGIVGDGTGDQQAARRVDQQVDVVAVADGGSRGLVLGTDPDQAVLGVGGVIVLSMGVSGHFAPR